MASSRRLDPTAIAALLRRRWHSHHRRWLDGAGGWPLTILLHPPTERATARDLAGVRDWLERWSAAELDPERPGELVWIERQWSGLGRQRLPERLVLADPPAVAAWVGEQARWQVACERAASIRRVLAAVRTPTRGDRDREFDPDPDFDFDFDFDPDAGAMAGSAISLGRHYDWLANASAADVARLLAVLRWLIEHPASGLYIRQLPIPGIHTKWLGANRGRLADLLAQHRRQQTGQEDPSGADLHRIAGLRREPDLMRLRILDPVLRSAVGGLGDLTAPVEQIAGLRLQPSRIFIVENLQTGLAFDDLPGALCCMARGYAVEVFATIPWLQGRAVHYWGDLDTHGFAILNRLRAHLPGVQSLLMDTDTLLRHRDLWEREDQPAAGPLARLTDAERAVFEGLCNDRWGERVRLEQERIDWATAWQSICTQSRP